MDKLEELKQSFHIEFNQLFEQCKHNKKFTFESQAKQNWYYTYLKGRLYNRLWNKYKFDIFDIVNSICFQKTTTTAHQLFDTFTDIKEIKIGDKE